MPQEEARAEAIRRAKARLAASAEAGPGALERRCARLGLPAPAGGTVAFPLFGRPTRLDLATLDLAFEDGAPPPQADQILFYHYLAYEGAIPAGTASAAPVSDGTGLIGFRDLPGGAFYWEPFRSRSSLPLAKRFGDDFPALRSSLSAFDWSELALGDFGARVHGFGGLFLYLVAWAGDEGAGAEVNVLFDPLMRRVYGAEDAAAFASRICLGLLCDRG